MLYRSREERQMLRNGVGAPKRSGRSPTGVGPLAILNSRRSRLDLTQDISHRAAKVAESHGLELVDVEIFRAGKRRVLRIYIGKREGVTVSDCAHVSRELGVLLDADNVMQDEAYVLEVSSPGLDRPFKSVQDYRRNVGRFVRATLREPIAGLGNKKL